MAEHQPETLLYPLPAPIAPEEPVEVRPGLYWVRLPLPFKLDHVNAWLLDDGEGWTVIDTGMANDRTRSIWESLFARVLDDRPVTRVVATHFHPDHIGLAGWIAQRWNAAFLASRTEWLIARMLCLEGAGSSMGATVDLYRAAGLDPEDIDALAARGNLYAQRVVLPPARLGRLRDGDTLRIGARTWTVLIGRGHSPEHVCLYEADERILIAGDQILPRISPNVSVPASEPESDPLGDFLESLDRLSALPGDVMVLPSHGQPFQGLHERIDSLRRHHDDRLRETLAACAVPQSVAEITRRMFRRDLDSHELMFAVGEALAHLNHLVAQGRLDRRIAPSGLWQFHAA